MSGEDQMQWDSLFERLGALERQNGELLKRLTALENRLTPNPNWVCIACGRSQCGEWSAGNLTDAPDISNGGMFFPKMQKQVFSTGPALPTPRCPICQDKPHGGVCDCS